MVQLAWLWLRHQPDSALALWFHDRVKRNGGRLHALAYNMKRVMRILGIGGLMAAMRA